MLFIFSLLVFGASIYYLWAADKKLKQYNESFRQGRTVSMILALFFGLIAFTRILTVIPAGHVGVVDFFGNVAEKTLRSGINFRNPFARIVKISVKTQQIYEDMEVPSKEGLTIKIGINCLYHLDSEKAAELYKTVGTNYEQVIIEPQFRSVCRGVTAGYEAKALYTSQREMLTNLIKDDLVNLVAARGITIESTPMRHIELPRKVTDAIEDKLKAEQESQRMEWVLTKEKQEAERKRIEARGIYDFQTIVSKGISEPLLRWKGIEATEKLATSNNAKVVIIGSGKDGLPVILDTK